MIDFSGKTAFVTGASRGIGLATAKQLAQLGANVVLAARSLNQLKQHASDIVSQGGSCITVQCDVADYRSLESALRLSMQQFASVDILINNAGVIEPIAPLAESDPELWDRAIDVNLKGVYHGIRAVSEIMLAQGAGTIINISSGAASSALEGWSHYCASKAGAKMITECAHDEMFSRGICVIGLSPGTVATDMMHKIKASGVNPVSQLDWSVHITPEFVARAIAFLCSSNGKEYSGTDYSLRSEENLQRLGQAFAT